MSRGALALLLIATALVLLPLSQAGLISDDVSLVLHNQWAADWSAIPRAFSHHLWASAPAGDATGPYYRPLMTAAIVIDRHLFGESSLAWHLHSLAWHLLCVGLLSRLLAGLGRPGAATLACVVFALHPVMIEPVAFVAARNDSMACAGVLAALILLEEEGPGRAALAALALLAALLCKESALAGLPMALLLDRARGAPTRWARYAGLCASVAIWAFLRSQANISPLELGMAPSRALAALGHYAGLLVWPPGSSPATELATLEPRWLTTLAGLALLAALLRRGGALGWAGLAMALVALAPGVMGALSAGYLAHRYLYLPMVGLALLIFAGAPTRWDRGLSMVLGLALALSNVREQRIWSTNRAYFEHAYAVSPSSRNACGVFTARQFEGETAELERWMRLALRPPPSEFCCFNATRWPLEAGQPERAVALGELALNSGCTGTPELVAPLAMSLALTGRWDAAEEWASKLEDDPWGYTPVVRAAAAMRRGDEGVLRALEERPEERRPLRERVGWLLGQPASP